MRPSGRKPNELRPVTFATDVNKYAEGSCLVKFGDTHVLCTASIEEKVPPFLRNSGKGWVTAEYGMLPRSTHSRMDRESAKGKQSGRTQEIQRLIGRALRASIDLTKLGERQIKIDCDVIQADGGTRTAAITGSYIALHLSLSHLIKRGVLAKMPLIGPVAAISCGIYKGTPILDLDYSEDSDAGADANFVMGAGNKIIEIQGTAEQAAFSEEEFLQLLVLAKQGIQDLILRQNEALGT